MLSDSIRKCLRDRGELVPVTSEDVALAEALFRAESPAAEPDMSPELEYRSPGRRRSDLSLPSPGSFTIPSPPGPRPGGVVYASRKHSDDEGSDDEGRAADAEPGSVRDDN